MLEGVLIFIAGMWAGGINVVVGSGTLVTFPVLLLFGYPPLVANVSNNIGLVAGGVAGVHGYRHELRPNATLLKQFAPASILGAVTGALLLLVLPAEAFKAIVPVLIGLGITMVVIGPSVQRRAARRSAGFDIKPATETRRSRIVLVIGVFILGAYGGYFGAAQGILMVGFMTMVLATSLQHLNAIKNVLTTLVNAVAAIIFIVFARDNIDWRIVALIGSGALLGGYIGARIGRRLAPSMLRALIVVIGVIALVKILFFG